MTNWIAEKVAELMCDNRAAVLDDFYAHGTGGSYRLIFEPAGCAVWLEDGSEGSYTRKSEIVKFGWESRISEESTYFESLYEVTSANIAEIAEEIAKDWEAARDRFYPNRPDEYYIYN